MKSQATPRKTASVANTWRGYLIRSVLVGLCFSLVLVASGFAAAGLIQVILPLTYANPILLIGLNIIEPYVTMATALGAGFASARWLGIRLGVPHPARVIILGTLIGLNLAWLYQATLLRADRVILYGGMIVLFAAGFAIAGSLHTFRLRTSQVVVVGVLAVLLVVVNVSYIAPFSSKAAFKAGVAEAGYTLYLPPAGARIPAPSTISPIDDNMRYDFTDGITFKLEKAAFKAIVYEEKYPGNDPAPDCGSGYISSAPGAQMTCSLVSETPEMKIYLASEINSQNEETIRTYFGVTRTTIIHATLTDSATGKTNDDLTKEFLMSLRAVKADSLPSTLRVGPS